MIEKGTIMESEAEPSSKELLKIYDTALAEKLMQKLLPMIEPPPFTRKNGCCSLRF